jgi:hypothetical protein
MDSEASLLVRAKPCHSVPDTEIIIDTPMRVFYHNNWDTQFTNFGFCV